jgi:raffinose/stachyose/melibiose transport system substrate-binding protein
VCDDRCPNGRISRRRLVETGGKGLVGLSLAGGLAAPTPAAARARRQDEPAEITWWVQQDTDMEYRQANVVDLFQEENPGITINLEPIPGDDMDRVVATALQSGAGPDILPSGGPAHAGALAQAGLLLDLDPYAEQYDWAEKLLPWALETGKFQGSLYQIPHEFECTIGYYGQNQFDENGWSLPTNRAEFEALAEDAMGKGIIPVAIGTSDCGLCTNWLVTIFFNDYAGPDAVYQALTGEIPFSDPIFVEAIELLNTYMQAGWFGGSVDRFFSTGFDAVHAQIADGRAAMSWSGTWFLSDLDRFFGEEAGNDNTWGWVQTPSFRAEVPYPLFPIGIGSTLSVASATEHPDQALRFLNWYYSDPARVARRIAEGGTRFTLPIPYQASDFPDTMDPRVAEVLTTLSEATATDNFGYTAWTFWPPKTHVYLHDEVQKVFTNELSPAEYCSGMAELFTQELEEGLVPPAIPRDIA